MFQQSLIDICISVKIELPHETKDAVGKKNKDMENSHFSSQRWREFLVMLPVRVLLVQLEWNDTVLLDGSVQNKKTVHWNFFICMIENLIQGTGIVLVVKCIENKQVKKQVNSGEYQKVHRNMLT